MLVAALQETKLTPKSNVSTRNFSLVRKDLERGGIGEGIAFTNPFNTQHQQYLHLHKIYHP